MAAAIGAVVDLAEAEEAVVVGLADLAEDRVAAAELPVVGELFSGSFCVDEGFSVCLQTLS